MWPRHYKNEEVIITTGWSSLDGKMAKVEQDSNGEKYVRLIVPGYKHSMLFQANEVLR